MKNVMELSLKELLIENAVKAKVQVSGRDEAIDYAGNLLVETGSIKSSYIAAMNKVFEDLGAYALIVPGIVLLHARPEDGAIIPFLGLISLDVPLVFSHSQNNSTDIVTTTGVGDGEKQVQVLAKPENLLSDQRSVISIRDSSSSKALYKNNFHHYQHNI